MTGILFDLDGTLLDTLGDLADSVNHVLTQFGYPNRTLDEIRRFVGNGVFVLIRRAIPENADPEPVLAAFRGYYQDHCRIKTGPYAGILDALASFKGQYPVAIVSNKPDSAVKALCADFFPGIYALGEAPDLPRKPAPDMVTKAMAAIGVDRCVYVGDSEVDVETARNAGVPCLSVTWGFRKEEEIRAAGGLYFCDAPGKLPETIETVIRSNYG